VIGYGFSADREMQRHMRVVAEDDVLAFARAVELEVETYSPRLAMERGREASEWVRRAYSREAEVEAVIQFYVSLRATAVV
jgi:hypothetical protein